MSLDFFTAQIQMSIDADRARTIEHGWSFDERTVNNPTIGDLIGTVLRIKDPTDAQRFYEGYIAWIEGSENQSAQFTPEYVAKANIGWCFGEGMDSDCIAMWNTVTGASHPVFGVTMPTMAEAFNAGLAAGEVRR